MVAPTAPVAVSVSVENRVPTARSPVNPNATYTVAIARRTSSVDVDSSNPLTNPGTVGTTTVCEPNRMTPPARAASATRIVHDQISTPATNAFATSSRPRATGRI